MLVRIKIPTHSSFHSNPGSTVTLGDQLFSSATVHEEIVPITSELKVSPSKVFVHLKVFTGDEVQPGDVVAEKKTFFGTKKVTSPHGGTVSTINHATGDIILETKGEDSYDSSAFFSGIISSIDEKKSELAIEIDSDYDHSPLKISASFGGKLLAVNDVDNYFTLASDVLEGAVLLVETLKPHVEAKAEAFEAGGIITKSYEGNNSLPYAIVNEEAYDQLLAKITKNQAAGDTSTELLAIVSDIDKKLFTYLAATKSASKSNSKSTSKPSSVPTSQATNSKNQEDPEKQPAKKAEDDENDHAQTEEK